MTTLLLAALALAAPDIDLPLRTAASAPLDTAVVVGIEDYVFVPDAPYAERDASAFYDLLVYTVGVSPSRIHLLGHGASREQIVAAAARAGDEVGAGGTVWVYFAGHGAADPSTGERLLLGDDVRQDAGVFASRGVPVSEVTELAARGGGHVVAIIDACYGGLGRDGTELIAGQRFLVPTYARPVHATVMQWDGASGDQLAAPLHSVRHGAFTYFAIGALRGWADGHLSGVPDGVVTSDEAHVYVSNALRTLQIRDQQPQLAIGNGAPRTLVSAARLEAPPDLDFRVTPRTRSPALPDRRNRPRSLGKTGAVLSGVGATAVAGTFVWHLSRRHMSDAEWVTLKTINTVGWASLVGGGTLVVVDLTAGGANVGVVGTFR